MAPLIHVISFYVGGDKRSGNGSLILSGEVSALPARGWRPIAARRLVWCWTTPPGQPPIVSAAVSGVSSRQPAARRGPLPPMER